MHAQACMFKRTMTDRWHEGVMINNTAIIIDASSKPVEEVYDYQLRPEDGCFHWGTIETATQFHKRT